MSQDDASGPFAATGAMGSFVQNVLLDETMLHASSKQVLQAVPGLDPAAVHRATLEPVSWGEEFNETPWLTRAYAGAQERLVEELQGLRADLERFADALQRAAADYQSVDQQNAADLNRSGSDLEQLMLGPLQSSPPVDNQASVEHLQNWSPESAEQAREQVLSIVQDEER